MSVFKSIIIVLSVILLASCSFGRKGDKFSYDDYHGYYKVGNPYQINGKWYHPKEQSDYDVEGIASWYGDEFHGKKTANGDTFDKHGLTAAHNTLPLPSMIRVTNLANNKTLIVMVNDRGPFSKDRILDVSQRAAQLLGFVDKGTAKVRVQFLKGQTSRLLASLSSSKKGKSKIKLPFIGRYISSKLDGHKETDTPVDLMFSEVGVATYDDIMADPLTENIDSNSAIYNSEEENIGTIHSLEKNKVSIDDAKQLEIDSPELKKRS